MPIPSDIFPNPVATPPLRFLTDNPVVTGWREEDRFRRDQAEHGLRMDRGTFDLERLKKSAIEADNLDRVLREVLGGSMADDPAATRPMAPVQLPAGMGGDVPSEPMPRPAPSGGSVGIKFDAPAPTSVDPAAEADLREAMQREMESRPEVTPSPAGLANPRLYRLLKRHGIEPMTLDGIEGQRGGDLTLDVPEADDPASMPATKTAPALKLGIPPGFDGPTEVPESAFEGAGLPQQSSARGSPAWTLQDDSSDALTGGDSMTNPVRTGTGLDRYEDPRMQRLARALAQTPGAGRLLFDETTRQLSARDKLRMDAMSKTFELAAKGQPELAEAYGRQFGVQIDGRMLRSQAMSQKMWDILKSMVGQDPAYVARVMREAVRGGDMGAALDAGGTPERRPLASDLRLGGLGGVGKPILRYVPGKGMYRFDPTTGEPELVVPVGDASSPYKMQARARDQATREAAGVRNSAWIDARTKQILEEYKQAMGAAGVPGADAGGASPPPGLPGPAGREQPSSMVPGGAARTGPDVIREAQDAIARGADPAAVRERARRMGVELPESGLGSPETSGAFEMAVP